MSHLIKRIVTLTVLCLGMGLFVSPDSAMAWKDGGPTAADFIRDGVFDQSGYLAALVAFETAPVVANDRPITVQVRDCPDGATITVVFVGFPTSQVQVSSTGSPTSVVVTPPVAAGVGFSIIRVTCVASLAPVTTRDIVVDLRPGTTPGALTTISAALSAGSAGTGGLPSTGADMRSTVGYATAALLVGVAVVFGARRRFHVPSIA